MSRIDFRVDRRLCTYGYLGRRCRSFDRSPIAGLCRARSPATLKRLRCSVFLHCPIGAIDSTYKSRKISKTYLPIFVKFSGFLGDIASRSHAKNWGNPLVRISGSGWERKKFTPIFSPKGGQGATKFFELRGLIGPYLVSKFYVVTITIGVGRG